MIDYHRATEDEKAKWDGDECYDLLVGPDGFKCFLGEREDRTWSRDGAGVVEELNRLLHEYDLVVADNQRLRKQLKEAKE